MNLHLVSDDVNIQELCRQVVAEILGPSWQLRTGRHLADGDSADLNLWDIDSLHGDDLQSLDAHEPWRHFFLVDRSAVEAFRENLPFRNASILLKPVTKAALAAFLTDVCRICTERSKASDTGLVQSLRADRDVLLQCVLQANVKLQEYDSDRTNFLARAIHDFRAPLTAITGYCGLLLSDDIGHVSDRQREVLQRMHHCARKLSRMANSMFQLSIWPRVQDELNLSDGDIRECIARAVDEVYPTAEEKRISISVSAANPTQLLLFDSPKLEQVLVNLLENACRFVGRGGVVHIEGYPWLWDRTLRSGNPVETGIERRQGDSSWPNAYRVDVRDSGPGIAATDASRIFEEYTSYAGGSDRSGGGLGLAICRMIVNRHKGHIWAEGAPSGAVFSFVLPFEAVSACARSAEKARGAGAS